MVPQILPPTASFCQIPLHQQVPMPSPHLFPRFNVVCVLCVFCVASFAPQRVAAQTMDHTKMMAAEKSAAAPQSGQAAFAAITDVVKKLKADPSTDWSKVNLEALRQHLIDMDNVVMRAAVKQANVAGGVSLDITGTGQVSGAIRRMGGMHAMALNEEGNWAAKSSEIPGGVRLVVTAKDAADSKAVALVRGLGFAGLFAEGDHHAMHHMMLAKGEGMMHK